MADLTTLSNHILNDPDSRGYSTMTDKEVKDDLFAQQVQSNINSFSGDFMFARTDPNEFSGLTEHKQVLWTSFCSKASVDPWETNNIEFVRYIFGPSSTTESNLGAERTEPVSRAEDLGYPNLTERMVHLARGGA